jgi:hypothetical protein
MLTGFFLLSCGWAGSGTFLLAFYSSNFSIGFNMITSIFYSQDSFSRAKKWVQELQKQGINFLVQEFFYIFFFFLNKNRIDILQKEFKLCIKPFPNFWMVPSSKAFSISANVNVPRVIFYVLLDSILE